jgi:hypothetical protein
MIMIIISIVGFQFVGVRELALMAGATQGVVYWLVAGIMIFTTLITYFLDNGSWVKISVLWLFMGSWAFGALVSLVYFPTLALPFLLLLALIVWSAKK